MLGVNNNGTHITYARSGQLGGVPLLLMPGLTENLGCFSDVAAAIGDDAEVFAMDFRGHGRSGRAPGTYTTSGYVSDAIAVIESAIRRPAIIAGLSLGANIAFVLAQTRPDLVLAALCEEPSIYFNDKEAREAGNHFKVIVPWLRNSMAQWQAGEGQPSRTRFAAGTRSDAFLDARMASLLDADPAVCDAFLDGTLYDGYDPDGPVGVPLTVLRGDLERGAIFSEAHEARLKRSTPHANVIHFAGAGHEIHADTAMTRRYLEELRLLVRSVG